MDIKVKYSTIDRFSQTRYFRTLEGARNYAQKWVGPTPEISNIFQYAVSTDGIGKIEVFGTLITDLFPALNDHNDDAPDHYDRYEE